MRWLGVRHVLGGVMLVMGLVGCQQTHVVPVAIEPRPACDFNALMAQRGAPAAQPVLAPQVPGAMAEMPLNAVNITDGAITNKIMVQATTARRTPTGTVEVWARLVNC